MLHRKRLPLLAKVLVWLNYQIYKADLPAECNIQPDIKLFHRGLGVVINPEVTIGKGVRIVHNVTVGVVTNPGDDRRGAVVIEDNVRIGVGAVVLAGPGKTLTLGEGCQIGAMAYVRRDVVAGDVVVAPVAQSLVGLARKGNSYCG